MEGWNFLTEYQQLCEAETEAFARLLGTPVQRLATIAHGDGICTTHVTAPALLHNAHGSDGPARRTAQPDNRTATGGISV